MGKASRKKRQSQPVSELVLADPPRWSGPLLAGSALAGISLAVLSTYVHYRVTSSSGGYTSFCNVSAAVNCDSVVTSSFAKLFGIPVSLWGLAFYLLLFRVALRAARPSPASQQARADAFALAVGGLAYSLYLAAVSIFVLETVCLLCAGLYLVSVASLTAAWALARPFGVTASLLRERWQTVRRHPALATAGAMAVAAIVVFPGWLGAPTHMTRQEVFRASPKFYDWYTGQPIVEDVPRDGGNAIGPENAPVTLVEFSDFECPHCGRAHVTLKDVLSRYANEVRFVFHHFPLSNQCNDAIQNRGHEHACAAAVAAECAAQAGRFAPYVNLLFANQNALGPDALKKYASEVGLDVSTFETCLSGSEATDRLHADVEAGKRAGVRSTPTFFLNGRKIEGNLSFQDWLYALAVELDKS